MHRLYCVMKYKEEYYLANLAVEERKVYYKDNYFDDINRHLYNVRDIKIAPVRLNLGFQSQGILSNDNRAEPSGAIISVAELYQIVKEYDRNFFENPMAVGRAK